MKKIRQSQPIKIKIRDGFYISSYQLFVPFKIKHQPDVLDQQQDLLGNNNVSETKTTNKKMNKMKGLF